MSSLLTSMTECPRCLRPKANGGDLPFEPPPEGKDFKCGFCGFRVRADGNYDRSERSRPEHRLRERFGG